MNVTEQMRQQMLDFFHKLNLHTAMQNKDIFPEGPGDNKEADSCILETFEKLAVELIEAKKDNPDPMNWDTAVQLCAFSLLSTANPELYKQCVQGGINILACRN